MSARKQLERETAIRKILFIALPEYYMAYVDTGKLVDKNYPYRNIAKIIRRKYVEDRRMNIDKAVRVISGYCEKVERCEECRFSDGEGNCKFRLNIPCDWDVREEGE